jgi:hypothetical protein
MLESYRAVIQFRIPPDLFDWFMNARTGYRAHFRVNSQCGLEFNGDIVDTLRDRLAIELEERVPGYLLKKDLVNCGPTLIPKQFILASLTRNESKVWMCTLVVGPDGEPTPLPIERLGPKIIISAANLWPAPYSPAEDAWLDVKGAFRGPSGPYQLKDPRWRAQHLHETGTA